MRRSLGIMGELEDQYDRDKKKSYSDSKYQLSFKENKMILA